MKKMRLCILAVLLCSGLVVVGQNLSVARQWYAAGDYAKAKPVFERYVGSHPSNGNYNLWYGVCCLRTGNAELAVKPLEMAVKKRVPSGQLYLAQAYHALYRYADAIQVYEDYIAELKRRRRSTQLADSLLGESRKGLSFIRGVERVCIIDSMVMDKDSFLLAYDLSPESGRLNDVRSYGQTGKKMVGSIYKTELGDRIFYSAMREEEILGIWTCNKLGDGWSKPHLLPSNINGQNDVCYPYVMPDGVTLYFSAKGPASLGGYDIFVTRYNADTNTYLEPQNIGMPFNSPANDYLYVVDEFNHIGWFATDRNQPKGKVCVYAFIPNQMKQVYDYESSDPLEIARLASLHAIRDTWTDKDAVKDALARLEAAREENPEDEQKNDFDFVIDDERTYHFLSDFRSEGAKNLMVQYMQVRKNYRRSLVELNDLRNEYQKADDSGKSELTPAIIDLERRLEQLYSQQNQMAKEVRQKELTSFVP